MPVYKNDSVSQSIGYKFLSNPTAIADLDQLFEAFEANQGASVKYIIMCN